MKKIEEQGYINGKCVEARIVAQEAKVKNKENLERWREEKRLARRQIKNSVYG